MSEKTQFVVPLLDIVVLGDEQEPSVPATTTPALALIDFSSPVVSLFKDENAQEFAKLPIEQKLIEFSNHHDSVNDKRKLTPEAMRKQHVALPNAAFDDNVDPLNTNLSAVDKPLPPPIAEAELISLGKDSFNPPGGFPPVDWDSQESQEEETEFAEFASNVNPPMPMVKANLEQAMSIAFNVIDINKIGSGGFGSVYSALDLTTGCKVAVKAISWKENRVYYETIGDWCSFVLHEVLYLKLSKSDKVVQILDYRWVDNPEVRNDSYLIIKTEWLNISLRRAIIKCSIHHHKVEPSLVAAVLRRLCKALQVLHKKHIVHHDVKPDNVMSDFSQEFDFRFWNSQVLTTQLNEFAATLKLIDMGLAVEYKSANSKDQGYRSGTHPFMCPEKLSRMEYDPYLADAYAVGVTALDFATGGKISDMKVMDMDGTQSETVTAIAKEYQLTNPSNVAVAILGLLEPEAERLNLATVLFLLDQ